WSRPITRNNAANSPRGSDSAPERAANEDEAVCAETTRAGAERGRRLRGQGDRRGAPLPIYFRTPTFAARKHEWLRKMPNRIEGMCIDKGLKMTEQRRVIARVLSNASDHPDVESVYQRAVAIDPNISIATVYRTVRLFEESNILERHDFGDGRARYQEIPEEHHDHLIDVQTGKVIEFTNEQIEALQREVARKLGFELVGHRLEL